MIANRYLVSLRDTQGENYPVFKVRAWTAADAITQAELFWRGSSPAIRAVACAPDESEVKDTSND